MGRKRGHSSDSEDEDKIRKRIANLQDKLYKKPKRRRVFIDSSSSEDESNLVETHAHVHVAESFLPLQPDTSLPSSQNELAAATSTAIPDVVAAAESVDSETELAADILELLGDAPKTEVALGPAVHKDIGTRWQEILKKGLTKENKDNLLKDYLIPSNCDLLIAPELNPEAKAALPEVSIKRDTAIFAKQKQIGTALAALAVTMDRVLKEDTKQNILKPLSDACRILCDNHYGETRIRRNFVVSSVNSSLKDALIDTPRDKFLFGDNVTDKLRAAKTIQRSGEALKAPAPQKTMFNKNNFTKRNNLNSQHRKTFSRGAMQSARGGSMQRPVTRSSMRQQQDRAPPPAARRQRSPPPPPRRSDRR